MTSKVIVTRYPSLAEYLKQIGVVPENTPVLGRVRPEDVRGCHVFWHPPALVGLVRRSGYGVCPRFV